MSALRNVILISIIAAAASGAVAEPRDDNPRKGANAVLTAAENATEMAPRTVARLSEDKSISSGEQRTYTLASGDKLSIKFIDRPNVSGEFRVREDNLLPLPLIGPVRAGGKTLVEVEQEINDAYERVLRATPNLLIDIAEWRPITVLGTVDKPGSYPFKGPMTVIQALAAAGGIYRPASGVTLMLDVLRETSQLEQATGKLKRALARKARIDAEMSGLADIEVPKRLREIASAAEIKELLATESSILQERRKTEQMKSAALGEQVTLIGREIEALSTQLEKVQEQIRLLDKESNVAEDLSSRGLATRSRAIERQLQLANMQATSSDIVAQRLRAEQTLRNAKRDKELAGPESILRLHEELKVADDEVLTNERSMRASQTMITRLGEMQAKPGTAGETSARVSYKITRRNGTSIETVDATESQPVEPGDVVQVAVIQ